MNFYTELSRHYDAIFPVQGQELALVSSLIAGKSRLLDIGCGTGNKTVHLAGERNDVIGFDQDAGMIAKAQDAYSAPNMQFMVMDMQAIDLIFPPGRFDAAVCLGNTLVHLNEPDAVNDVLRQIHRVLAPGGVFVVQILNYDRIFDNHIDELPVIDTPSVTFTRRNVWCDGEMHFVTTLTDKADGASYENSIVLRPLRKQDVEEGLAGAGFTTCRTFGGYDGSPWREDSFHLIAAASR